MVYAVEVKDPYCSRDIASDNMLLVSDKECDTILKSLRALDVVLPMQTYEITRVTGSDVWNVEATSVDARTYEAVITSPMLGHPLYAVIGMTNSTELEVDAFMSLSKLWGILVKRFEVETVVVTWTH